jgi:HemY protein
VIRVVLFLLLVAALAFGAVWLADRPGDVVITWLGRRIETSVMVLVLATLSLAILTTLLWSTLRAIAGLPRSVANHLRTRRGTRAYLAVSQGLVAVGSGDLAAARRFSAEAYRIAPREPLALLLQAQTAQLAGEREAATHSFQDMARRDDTRLLGLHGLFIEARRRNDPAAALLYAEEAARDAATPPWAGQAVLEFRCIAADWSGALERLDRNMHSGLIDKAVYRRQRAVLLTAQALAAEEVDRDRAKSLALEAVKLAPTLVPAAALVGRLLSEAGELRKAARTIETAWRASPHPDLANVYAHLRSGDSARERLARIQSLAAEAAGNVEAALAVTRAALDAREFAIAREVLTPLTTAPTKRVAVLMAELEHKQHGDEGRARAWMVRALRARRDPAWTADGFVSERWLPASPITGHLDAFEWKDPLAGDEPTGVLIEAEEPPATAESSPPGSLSVSPPRDIHDAARRLAQDAERDGGSDPERLAAKSMAPPEHEAGGPSQPEQPTRGAARAERPRRRRTFAPIPVPPAVIPLVHAPDDPGPDPETHNGQGRKPSEEPATDNWTRIRQLFRH